MKDAFKRGVIGGIGSGKTSVCRVFDVLGVPVFSADREAQEIMKTDKVIIGKINSIVGKDLYINGSLNRKELATIIFNDSTPVSYTHLRAHETGRNLVCRLL